MSKLAGCLLGVSVLLVPLAGVAQQRCQSEDQIPSSTPTGRFTDHGNGTWTDNGTGLMWAKCAAGLSGAGCTGGSAGTYTWQGALAYAAASELAGYTNWRLPNVSELLSIVEQRCYGPSINSLVFPNTPGSTFWSSSPFVGFPSYAWVVNFWVGGSEKYFTRTGYDYVRLVRAGE